MLSTPSVNPEAPTPTPQPRRPEHARDVPSKCANWVDTAGGSVPIAEILMARATSRIQFVANLDAHAPIPEESWTLSDPTITSNFTLPITVFDALGLAHEMVVCFRKLDTSRFDYHVLLPGDSVEGAQTGRMIEVGTGRVAFGIDGTLLRVTESQAIEVLFRGTEFAQSIVLDLGVPRAEGGVGDDGLTGYAMASCSSFQCQDGYMGGRFATLEVSPEDRVFAVYTNGQRLPLLDIA